MKEKITLTTLSSKLSDATGFDIEKCEKFIRTLFATTTEALSRGEQVKIKGIGTFRIIEVEARKSVNISTGEQYEIAAHNRVTFTADKKMAEAVNSEFEMFDAVPVDNDEITEEYLNDALNPQLPETDWAEDDVAPEQTEEKDTPEIDETPAERVTIDVTPAEAVTIDEDVPNDETASIDEEEADETHKSTEQSVDEADTESQPDTESEFKAEPESESIEGFSNNSNEAPSQVVVVKHSHFWGGFVSGFVACLLICGGIAWGFWKGMMEPMPIQPEVVAEVEEEDSLIIKTPIAPETDTVSEEAAEEEPDVPTLPSDSPVYDTITTTRYLTTMARDHYGSYHLWPWIYEENKTILGHPDRIKPGTKVVIPNLKKYGVDPKNPNDIAKAKQKGVEIYNRFR